MTQTSPARDRRPYLMLGLATLGFALNFWAWALLSPLGPRFKDALDLTSFQQALLVAVPVIVGALGRIRVHALLAFLLFASWPFTRLVHAFSAPVGYLFRPYVVYRRRAATSSTASRPVRRGWERADR